MSKESRQETDRSIGNAIREDLSDLRFTQAMRETVREELESAEADRFAVSFRRVAWGLAAAASFAIIANLALLFTTTGGPAGAHPYPAELPGAAVAYNEEVLE